MREATIIGDGGHGLIRTRQEFPAGFLHPRVHRELHRRVVAIAAECLEQDAFSERLGWELPYLEFIVSGKWDVDDVLRPIYEEASEAMGREFPYPEN